MTPVIKGAFACPQIIVQIPTPLMDNATEIFLPKSTIPFHHKADVINYALTECLCSSLGSTPTQAGLSPGQCFNQRPVTAQQHRGKCPEGAAVMSPGCTELTFWGGGAAKMNAINQYVIQIVSAMKGRKPTPRAHCFRKAPGIAFLLPIKV